MVGAASLRHVMLFLRDQFRILSSLLLVVALSIAGCLVPTQDSTSSERQVRWQQDAQWVLGAPAVESKVGARRVGDTWMPVLECVADQAFDPEPRIVSSRLEVVVGGQKVLLRLRAFQGRAPPVGAVA